MTPFHNERCKIAFLSSYQVANIITGKWVLALATGCHVVGGMGVTDGFKVEVWSEDFPIVADGCECPLMDPNKDYFVVAYGRYEMDNAFTPGGAERIEPYDQCSLAVVVKTIPQE